MADFEKDLDRMIETDIDAAVEQKHQYDYDEEMANAEPDFPYCCEECEFWDAFSLKHGISRSEIEKVKPTNG